MVIKQTCHTIYSSIFRVYTVVATQCIGRTVNESAFSSTTLDIVQPDLTRPIRYSSKNERCGT